MRRPLFALLCAIPAAALSTATRAQTFYDLFNGTAVNNALWYFDGSPTTTVAGGFLLVGIPPGAQGSRLETTFGFTGDFDFVLDFQGLAGTGNLSFGVHDADFTGPSHEMVIETAGGAAGSVSVAAAIRMDGQPLATGIVTGAATGDLRLRRAGALLEARFRPSGSSFWMTVCSSIASPMGPEVQLWIATGGGPQAFSVSSGSVLLTGGAPWLPSAIPVGPRCRDVDSRMVSFPRVGTTFGLAVRRTQPTAVIFEVFGWQVLTPPQPLTNLGAPNCHANVTTDLVLLAGVTNSAGESVIVHAIPSDPQLVGVALNSQFAARDVGANALGFATSNALTFSVY